MADMTDFERFQEHGRLRRIAKSIDKYACVFERDNHMYVVFSTGQVLNADHLHDRSDNAVYGWLTTLYYIRKAFTSGQTNMDTSRHASIIEQL